MAEIIRYVDVNTYGVGVGDSISPIDSLIHDVLCFYPLNDECREAKDEVKAYNIGAIPLKKENLYIVYCRNQPTFEKPCAIIDGVECHYWSFVVVKRIKDKIIPMNDEEIKYAMNVELIMPTDEEEDKAYREYGEVAKVIDAFRITEGKNRFAPYLNF